jgi:hypothetical protein
MDYFIRWTEAMDLKDAT